MISDVGMCGPYNGILGSSRDEVIKRTWTGAPTIFSVQEDDRYIFNAISITIDDETKRIIDYKIINEIVKESELKNA